jgi:xanthine dehydrogenase YagR molybdenum-binding subunit
MLRNGSHVGAPRSRVDGRAKVTGAAKYAAEHNVADLLHGQIVSSAIAKGRVVAIDVEAAMAVPGVVKVFTHENLTHAARRASSYTDEVAVPGTPFRPLHDDRILFSGQPIALVVATSFEIASHGASLVRATYAAAPHATDLEKRKDVAYTPPQKREGIGGPPEPRGNATKALDRAPVRIEAAYHVPIEHHNPMEMHASTVVFEGNGKIAVYDKTQGVQNTHAYITSVFGLGKNDVRVLSPFVGGAFGSALRPQYQLFLAVMAALDLERSVRVVLTRDQMFTLGYRPETWQEVKLGADTDGMLRSIQHHAVASTSSFEDYQEPIVEWSGLLYQCDNAAFGYRLAKLDTATPMDMRAPGAPSGIFALESAMDELAYAVDVDPLQLRLMNYAEKDQTQDRPFTSKELRAAYQIGAERFGWRKRNPKPRSMRDGRELVGWGMASGIWEASMQQTSARAVLTAEGRLEVATAMADIGTGTYTILTQIAADALGLRMEDVTVRLGDSTLPASPVEGGSWGAASAGSAVQSAVHALRDKLFRYARRMDGSPLANVRPDRVVFKDRCIALAGDPSQSVSIADAMRSRGVERIQAEETASPDKRTVSRYACNSHSAVFAEVKVDEQLGIVRVTRIVNAVAAGRILNPKTARSQIIGGVVFGIGMALEEETVLDHALGRFMTHHLADYHVPVNADIHDIDVIFVEEKDDKANPLGIKGVGEIGIVGTAAAIANAVYHATGVRVRDLPITVDKILASWTKLPLAAE